MMNNRLVAVVTPYYRASLTADEEISLRHLRHYLSEYDRYLVVPEHLRPELDDFKVQAFASHYFTGTDSYSQLLLTPAFYEAFQAYEYILIYQLDALVFSDQLSDWCARGYDYIGAPWLKDRARPEAGLSRGGNGGLSLRRVDSMLEVLSSDHGIHEISYWWHLLTLPLEDIRLHFRGIDQLVKRLKVFNQARRGVGWYTRQYKLNEDHFWVDRARLFSPAFELAPTEIALQFSFEAAPRTCFEQNQRQLPFGTHAWAKWDRAFWEPFLLKADE